MQCLNHNDHFAPTPKHTVFVIIFHLMLFSDRTGGGKFCEEYELATTKLEEFSELLKKEQQERSDMIKVLEDGEAFYDTSYGEVKVIVHVSAISEVLCVLLLLDLVVFILKSSLLDRVVFFQFRRDFNILLTLFPFL